MRASKVSAKEQYRLVMECRASGLTDCQWCLEHGIKPGTFYNWVKRLRRNPDLEVPAAHQRQTASVKQEVVKVEFQQSATEESEAITACLPTGALSCLAMELKIGTTEIRVYNGTDPQILLCAIRALKEAAC